MTKEEEMIESVMKIAEGETPKVKKGGKAFFDNIFEKGMMPKDALGVQESDTEALYAQGYQLYNMGKYKDARSVFGSLMLIDPIDPRFLFGHAACSHMLEEYKVAADMYMHQAIVAPDDPIPYYHAADCYIKLGDLFSASVSLNLVIKRSGSEEKYKMIKERSEMTVKKIEEQLSSEIIESEEDLGAPEEIEAPETEDEGEVHE
jgi:type III secretion system low calcium response chaperone LcrH/SycD